MVVWVLILNGVLFAILVDEALALALLATELWVIFALALVLVVDFVELNISSLTVDDDFVLLLFAFVEVMLFVDLVVCVVIVVEAPSLELFSNVSSFEVVVSVSVGVTVKIVESKVEDVVVC